MSKFGTRMKNLCNPKPKSSAPRGDSGYPDYGRNFNGEKFLYSQGGHYKDSIRSEGDEWEKKGYKTRIVKGTRNGEPFFRLFVSEHKKRVAG